MTINFNKALGIHEHALMFRTKRAEVLANNLVNADTPNFKARDIDFRRVLESQISGSTNQARLMATNSKHIGHTAGSFSPELMYRIPMQPSLDGNTVEEQVEMSKFAQNSMEFQASFQFLNSKFRGLRNAIKGES